LITAPFFLGTKMEAFYDRGENDYHMSHDLEDFIALWRGETNCSKSLPKPRQISANTSGKQRASFCGTSDFWMHFRDMFWATRSANSQSRLSLSA
jgi:hypothetical protein